MFIFYFYYFIPQTTFLFDLFPFELINVDHRKVVSYVLRYSIHDKVGGDTIIIYFHITQ